MTPGLLLSAAIFSFVLAVTPGPNNTVMLLSAANFGLKKTLPYLFGILAGLAVMLVAIGAGLGLIFATFPVIYQTLKWIGFGYILWLAYQLIRSSSKSTTGESKQVGFWRSTIFQFANPKAWIAAASFMTAFVPLDTGLATATFTGSIFLIASFPGAFIWVAAGQMLGTWLSSPARRRSFNISSAVLLVLSMIPVMFLH